MRQSLGNLALAVTMAAALVMPAGAVRAESGPAMEQTDPGFVLAQAANEPAHNQGPRSRGQRPQGAPSSTPQPKSQPPGPPPSAAAQRRAGPPPEEHHERRRRPGWNVGVAAGVMAAIIAAQAAKSAPRDDGDARDEGYDPEDRVREWARQCRKWDRMCEDGVRWACNRLEEECE